MRGEENRLATCWLLFGDVPWVPCFGAVASGPPARWPAARRPVAVRALGLRASGLSHPPLLLEVSLSESASESAPECTEILASAACSLQYLMGRSTGREGDWNFEETHRQEK